MKTLKNSRENGITLCILAGILSAMIFFLPVAGSQTDNFSISHEPLSPLIPQQNKFQRGPFGSDPEIIISPDSIIELAKTDHIALLNWSLQTYQKRVRDYTATFYKQERIGEKLKKLEQISIMFKEKPFSVFMKWQKKAARINKLLYVEGKNDNQMVVHPTGMFAWIKSVKQDPGGKEAKESNLRTCDQFGFHRTIKSLLAVYESAQKKGDLITKYLGETKIDGRRCIAIERTLPPGKNYPDARMVLEFDVEYLLPVSLICFDWQDKLLARYIFHDLKFNNGLSSAKFSPKAHDM